MLLPRGRWRCFARLAVEVLADADLGDKQCIDRPVPYGGAERELVFHPHRLEQREPKPDADDTQYQGIKNGSSIPDGISSFRHGCGGRPLPWSLPSQELGQKNPMCAEKPPKEIQTI